MTEQVELFIAFGLQGLAKPVEKISDLALSETSHLYSHYHNSALIDQAEVYIELQCDLLHGRRKLIPLDDMLQ